VIERSIRWQQHAAVPMETRGIVALWEPGRGFLLYLATQNPFMARSYFARILRVPEHQVRISTGDVGIGADVLELPITPERVLAAINRSSAARLHSTREQGASAPDAASSSMGLGTDQRSP
jgi:aerobic carbon-monoxide dehydrogenase large subunit